MGCKSSIYHNLFKSELDAYSPTRSAIFEVCLLALLRIKIQKPVFRCSLLCYADRKAVSCLCREDGQGLFIFYSFYLEENMKIFWKEVGEQYLYCFIPIAMIILQLLLALLCMMYKNYILMFCLSTIILTGLLNLYAKLVYRSWNYLKRWAAWRGLKKVNNFQMY